jgi:hypothetical protein
MVLIMEIEGEFLRTKDGRETKPGKNPGNSSGRNGRYGSEILDFLAFDNLAVIRQWE